MRTLALLAAVGAVVVLAVPARAGELGGSYAGSLRCRLPGAAVTDHPSLMVIRELASAPEGARLVVEVDGVRYSGRAANGDAAFTRCGAIHAAYGEPSDGFEQVAYGVSETGAVTVRTRALLASGFCEASWTRIDALEPALPACGQ